MIVTEVNRPINQRGPWHGYAASKRGLRYFWGAEKNGKLLWADREDAESSRLSGKTLWWCLGPRRAPAALGSAVKQALQ